MNSSSRSSFGEVASARASSSRLRSISVSQQAIGLGRHIARGVTLATVEPADQHVLARGQPGERSNELEGAGDAPDTNCVRGQPADGMAVEADLSGVGAQGAGDEIEQRGLARAVRPHDADQLAFRQREADVADGAHPAEALADARHLEEWRADGRPRLRAQRLANGGAG
jgi:hypothetical protein